MRIYTRHNRYDLMKLINVLTFAMQHLIAFEFDSFQAVERAVLCSVTETTLVFCVNLWDSC